MVDSIEIKYAALDSPEAMSLCSQLSSDNAMIYVIRLWIWSLQHLPDGDLTACDAEMIAKAARWPGDPEVFVNALFYADLLEDRDPAAETIPTMEDCKTIWLSRRLFDAALDIG